MDIFLDLFEKPEDGQIIYKPQLKLCCLPPPC